MCSALIARVSPGVKRDSVFDADYMSRRDTDVNTEGWGGGGWGRGAVLAAVVSTECVWVRAGFCGNCRFPQQQLRAHVGYLETRLNAN